ncbi:MAG: murein biosynthesis integral membrane protein MurJ [Ilumatobacter sp.]|uniref:murein biosynthesis integral membrane protein MurJ n=1 Tax=Ilumatobacter sp. TaxID=1967498 RepID=UPI003C732803
MSGLLKSNLIVAVGTLLSRTTGLARVVVLTTVLGGTALSDAYILANETPNLVYELLVGGVLSATLIPLFTTFDRDEDDEARNVVVTTAASLILLLTIIAVAAAPLIFRVFSQRIDEDVDADLFRSVGTTLARIFLVQILFYGLTGLANAYLNSKRRFFAAAWSPVLPNVIIIATLLTIPQPDGREFALTDVLDDTRLRLTLGLGATLGIGAMAFTLLPAARRAGLRPTFVWNLRHPAVKKLLSLSFWTVGFVAANIAALIVIRNLTEPGSSGSTAYFAAFTFFILPHGLLGVSIATTFQPEMARAVAERSKQRFIESASLGIRMTALLTIPAGVGIFVLRRPLIGATLQYRNFTAEDALLTSRTLGGLALGLGAFSVYFFVLRAFYAHQDTKTAFKINLVENAINIVVGVALVGAYGVLGLGASFAIAYVIAATWALQILSYKVSGFSMRTVLTSLFRMIVAATLMGESVWFIVRSVGGNQGGGAFIRLAVGTFVGIVVYGVLLAAMGAPELDALRRRLPARLSGRPPSPAD